MSSSDDRIVSHLSELKILAAFSTSSREQIRYIIKNAGDPLLRCIQEIALNVRYSNLPIKSSEFNILQQNKEYIRSIGKKNIAKRALKRRILSRPEVIPYIIRPALRAYKIKPFYKHSIRQYDNSDV
jgi:hypothetical protein